jgi:hypothetical protein
MPDKISICKDCCNPDCRREGLLMSIELHYEDFKVAITKCGIYEQRITQKEV